VDHSFSNCLRSSFATASKALDYSWNRLFEAPNARERFIWYLMEMYHYVKFSCPLMGLVLSHRPAAAFSRYLENHIAEESGHEQWVLDDLERLGLPRSFVVSLLPSRENLALIGTQYYIIQNLHPLGYFGYIYALECNPPSLASIADLSRRLLVPLECLTALAGHAEADPGHIQDLNAILDSPELETRVREVIQLNLLATVERLSDLVLSTAVGPLPSAGARGQGLEDPEIDLCCHTTDRSVGKQELPHG
jgi:hypothetical protein